MRTTHVTTPVLVVGAGPTGLVLALALAEQGIASVLVDDDATVSAEGSRAICVQGHSLAILSRLGAGVVVQEGMRWEVGRTYLGTRELFANRVPAEGAGELPRFVNIPQTRVEQVLLAAVEAAPLCRVRWRHRVERLEQDESGVTVHATGPEGPTSWRAAYVVGADGARSTVRDLLGVTFDGTGHADAFLIADVRARLPFPRERRFYFDPPWNPGRQLLIHPQPDDLWRIDWQVPTGFDLDSALESGDLERRIRTVIGTDVAYELVWASVYTFRQRLAPTFRSGRVFLAGDAAHTMSVFGARGMNSGIQDADNLAWKVAYAVRGEAGKSLLDSYDAERRAAAEVNLAVTGATMRFMSPPTRAAALRRRFVLAGSRYSTWLRGKVDSGQLSEPATYRASPVLQPGAGALAPELPVVAPDGWRGTLRDLRGGPLVVLAIGPSQAEAAALVAAVSTALAGHPGGLPPHRFVSGAAADATADHDAAGTALGNLLVVRPDGHLAWKVNGEDEPGEVAAALADALLNTVGR